MSFFLRRRDRSVPALAAALLSLGVAREAKDSVVVLPSTSLPAKVTGVRFWSMNGVTRVAIEASGSFEFHWDRLHNPDRVFFDVLNAIPSNNPRGISVI